MREEGAEAGRRRQGKEEGEEGDRGGSWPAVYCSRVFWQPAMPEKALTNAASPPFLSLPTAVLRIHAIIGTVLRRLTGRTFRLCYAAPISDGLQGVHRAAPALAGEAVLSCVQHHLMLCLSDLLAYRP